MRFKCNKFILSGALLFGTALNCTYAARPVDLGKQNVAFLQQYTSPTLGAIQDPAKIEEISRSMDRKDTLHVRVQQTYAGHPVFGADAIIHVPQGRKAPQSLLATLAMAKANGGSLDGTIYQDLNKDLTNVPKYLFTEAQANKILQQAIDDYQKKMKGHQSISHQKSHLIVYIDQNNKAHWAYQVSFFATGPKANDLPASPIYMIDAHSFEIYQQWDDLKTLNKDSWDDVFGGGFGGNKKMGQLIYDGLEGHLSKLNIQRDASKRTCSLKNPNVIVKRCTSFWGQCMQSKQFTVACEQVDPDHNNVYWNGDQDAINDGYSPSNDALFGGMVIKDMYKNWYGMDVLVVNGKPMTLTMVVHLPYFDNAYWYNGEMNFGDGHTLFYPLTSLGVAAHEISHGFTEQHSGLIYSGQSGGMNEAFSDMAAQAAEAYAYKKNSWQIGPEIFKQEDRALRYMDQPSKDCNGKEPGNNCSIDNANQYHSGLNVHYSSGVYNRAFYLLGTSEGWDVRKAFEVMINANAHYWTSNATFQSGACGVIKAAKGLGYDTTAVKNAFATVGVDTQSCM